MSPSKRYAKKQAKARQHRRLQVHERLERDRRQAQRAAEALHQALEDWGLPENLVVEIEGRLVVPVDFAMRRPAPGGPGAPCRDKLRWARVMLDEWVAALRQRGLELPAPIMVAASGFSASKLMEHGGKTHQGTLLVEGKQSSIFPWANGQKVKGHDLIAGKGWRWRQAPWETGVYYARLRATSPTSGQVTIVIVDEPGQDRFSLRCLETTLSAPQLIRWWRRRTWIACVSRTLKHLLGTKACQVHSEGAYDGHLVVHLMGSLVLFYTSRVSCKGCLTMEAIILSLKHYWRLVDLEALGWQALSSGVSGRSA